MSIVSRRTGSLFAAVLAALVLALSVMAATPASAASYGQMRNQEQPWFSGPVCLEIEIANAGQIGQGQVEWCSYNSMQQQWSAVPVPDAPGYYLLRNFHTNRCLKVNYASYSDGAQTVQDYCNNYNYEQHWKFVPVGNGFAEVVARHSGKCLTNSGWNALQYNCNGAANQHWTLPPVISA